MTTTLRDDRPAKASRSSCGFCDGGHGQPPSVCYDADGRGKGTCYGAVPALTLAVAMAMLSWAKAPSALASPWASLRRAGTQAVPERYLHRLSDLSPHPRRQVIPYARYDRELRRGT